MGTQTVRSFADKEQKQKFIRALLNDVRSLEYMLHNDWFETGVTRFGSELEMVLVDNDTLKPTNIATKVLSKMKGHKWLETELAKFNLEINLTPRELKGNNFSLMEKEIQSRLSTLDTVLKDMNASYVLTGILPTIQKYNLNEENLTPRKRYYALMEAIKNLNLNRDFELKIFGIDELFVRHNTPLIEAANTSWQIHLQIAPRDYVRMYNVAQALAGPCISLSANSPIVFGKRLWHESRIAMFEQALDTRNTHEHMREQSTRVSFGNEWLNDSILDIYRDDISRFKVILSSIFGKDSWKQVLKGKVPDLDSLLIHNSTVYRWNRPQYGISENGQPHLRIENRVMPAGPTVIDQMANAAFWLGAMKGLSDQYPDIRNQIEFSSLKDNFGRSARFGMEADYSWIKGKKLHVRDLLRKELIPLAREGLKSYKIKTADIDRYTGVLEERVKKKTNGAIWILDSYANLLKDNIPKDETLTILTHSIMKNQKTNLPGHTWKTASLKDLNDYQPLELKVSEFMQTDLQSVEKDDILELVGEIMDWRKIRYMPVEDSEGKLEGLITSRILSRYFINALRDNTLASKCVGDIMITDPITVEPETSIRDAMKVMREHKVGGLLVVKNNILAGIITETDFLDITSSLLERLHNKNKKTKK